MFKSETVDPCTPRIYVLGVKLGDTDSYFADLNIQTSRAIITGMWNIETAHAPVVEYGNYGVFFYIPSGFSIGNFGVQVAASIDTSTGAVSKLFTRGLWNTSWGSWHTISQDIPTFYKNYSDLSSLATALGGVGNMKIASFNFICPAASGYDYLRPSDTCILYVRASNGYSVLCNYHNGSSLITSISEQDNTKIACNNVQAEINITISTIANYIYFYNRTSESIILKGFFMYVEM